jgi:hypothetical protein
LKVYDDTISFARLSDDDKVSPTENDEEEESESGEQAGSVERGRSPPPSPPPPPPSNKAILMAGERELTAGLLSKDANFRLIVSGQIGVKEIERLIAKLNIDKEILAETDAGAEEDLVG